MKTNCWLILGTMLATSAVAQVNTNKLPEIPAPAIAVPAAPVAPPVVTATEAKTNAPAKKVVKKKTAKKAKSAAKAPAKAAAKTLEKIKGPELPVTLVPGPATVTAEHINLRGQAGLKGEVVGHVQKGDTVTVISEITVDKPKAGEPAQWAKVALPSGTKVWVDSKYVDTTNNVVAAKKLNLRGGPGENYSVLGVIEKGAAVTVVSTKNGWTEIQAPASAFAFVAASYLKQDGSLVSPNVPVQPVVATAEAVPPPPAVPATTTTVTEAQPIAPPAATPPPTPQPVVAVAPPAAPVTPEPAAATPPPVTPTLVLPQPTLAEDDTNLPPPPPRIVTHEGSVRHSVSLVAPTYYELYDPTDYKAINYLYTTSTNLNLARYNGLHITVTGEEGMDVRWKDTPILTIQKIYVISDEKTKLKPVKAYK